VVITFVILLKLFPSVLWIVQTFVEMALVKLESRHPTVLVIVHTVEMDFVKHLVVKMFSHVKQIVELAGIIFVNPNSKIQYSAQKIVAPVEIMSVNRITVKISKVAQRIVAFLFAETVDAKVRRLLILVPLIVLFLQVTFSSPKSTWNLHILCQNRTVVLVVEPKEDEIPELFQIPSAPH